MRVMTLSGGSRLGTHEIIGLLGAGGMGEVYRARDTKLNREVAIKVLPEAYARDPERIGRFHREALAIAALNHPHIASIYDLAEADGTKYLVLELVDGETLADRLRQGPLPVDEALQIGRQILEALEAAHEKGICHRDLKPANVKLTADGVVKVLDFGLAKFAEDPAASGSLAHSPTLSLATFPGVILGTAAYISPEAAKGYAADHRSDIFSFGCVLYELLSGGHAFEGETASEILASVLKSEVDFTRLPPPLHPRLVEALRRCLEKNPRKRWHAAADLRLELESIIPHPFIEEAPAAIPPARTQSRWRTALIAASCLIVGAAAAAPAVWTLKRDAPRAVARFVVPLPEDQRFTSTGRRIVTLSPDGRHLVYVANQQLYLRPLASLESRPISGSETVGSTLNPVFSPDSRSVAFFAIGDGTLKRLEVTGGVPVTICAATAPLGLSWSEHGLVFGQAGVGIMRVAAAGGTPEVIAPVAAGEVASAPQMLPGGRAVLFSVKALDDHWDKGRIVVQPLDGGERKVLLEGGADGRYVPTGHLLYAVAGVVLAVPMDLDRLEVTGGAVPVVEGVRRGLVMADQGPGIAQLSVSMDGTLAFVPGPAGVAADVADLALIDGQGTITPLKLPPMTYRSPRVSPDGSTVAVETESNDGASVSLYVLDGRTAVQRLTLTGNNRAPVWSPEGQWVVFQSDREGDHALFRQRADGAGVAERLSRPAAGEQHLPHSWSPDGAHLLVTIKQETEQTLGVLSLKDRRIERFDDVRANHVLDGAFSPDGRWIVYRAEHTFVEPFPRTGAKYQVPRAGGHPVWSPKGDRLRLNIAPTRSAWVAVTTAPRVSFGVPVEFTRPNVKPNPRTSRRGFDFLPGGERIIGVVDGGQLQSSGTQITVVLNWFEELRQRSPVR